MTRAAAKIQQYVPPDPARIQSVADAGKLSVMPLAGGASVRLELHDYLQAGDLLRIELDLQTNKILSAKISSYVDSPADKVSLDVLFSNLPDGTSYASQTTLDAPEKKVRVLVQNTGHRWAG